jgi:His/Glu/Gln/Arg/opine family amino acid ABC transporter permease subunit
MPPWVGPVADYLATGLRETALLALVSIAASLLVGTVLGAVLTLPSKPVRAVVRTYVEIWRGLPIIIILYFIFFVLPIIGILVDTFVAAAVGLSLWGSANMAEVVRGAVQSVPRGQDEAAAALEASQRSIERLTLSGGSSHAVPILGAVLVVFFVICLPLTMLSRWYERRLH